MVAVYYRTNQAMRQLAPLFGVSSSTVCRVIQRLGPLLSLEPVSRPSEAAERLWIVDGTLLPVRDRHVGSSSRNYRFSANVQVIVGADTRLVIAASRPVPGTTADAHAWRVSGLARRCEGVTLLGDGAYLHCGMSVPHRKRPGRALLKDEEDDNAAHRKVRPGGACDRPDEELQDPPRLPTARRRSPPRGPGHRLHAQPRPRIMTREPRSHTLTCPNTALCNTF